MQICTYTAVMSAGTDTYLPNPMAKYHMNKIPKIFSLAYMYYLCYSVSVVNFRQRFTLESLPLPALPGEGSAEGVQRLIKCKLPISQAKGQSTETCIFHSLQKKSIY